MCALFIASFTATHWILSADTIAAAATAHQNTAAFAVPTGDAPLENVTVPALNSVEIGDPEPPTEAAPSLQDLATDNDPETRGEAQALLGLLDQERVFE